MMNRLLLICLLPLSINVLFLTETTAGALDEGWEAFISNDMDKAEIRFLEALDDHEGSKKKEILTMLAITKTYNENEQAGIPYLKKLFETNGDVSPYFYALWEYNLMTPSYSIWSEERYDLFRKISTNESIDPTVRTMAKLVLSGYYWYHRDVGSYEEMSRNIGDVHQWQTTGTFENISASGFDKNHGPLKAPEPDATFTAQNGNETTWHTLEHQPQGEWIMFDYHYLTFNSIKYAQTFVESPVEQEIQVRAGAGGSLKLWVNDDLVISESKERNTQPDSYVYTVTLQEGWNRILVQSGESYGDVSHFLLRLTDTDGNNLNLKSTPEHQSYNTNANANAEELSHFAVEYFQNRLKENNEDLFSQIMLFKTYLSLELLYDAKHLNIDLKEKASNSSYVNALKVNLYSLDGNEAGVSRVLEHIKNSDPEGRIAFEMLYNQAIENQNFREAEKFVDKIESAEGQTANVYEKRIEIADNRGQHQNLIFLIEEAYEKYPINYYFVLYKSIIEQNVNNDIEAAREVFKQFLNEVYNADAKLYLAGLYFDHGQHEEGFEVLQKLLDNHPRAAGFYSEKGEKHFSFGNYEEALELFEKGAEIAPYVSDYHALMGYAYEEMGKNENAIEKYKYALELNPVDYETRRKMRDLMDRKQPFEYFDFDEDALYEKIENIQDTTEFSDENSYILIDENQKVLYREGASEEKRYLSVKMLNSSGVDDWKELTISRTPRQYLIIEKAEVIKKDGSRISADQNNNEIVFTNLEPGDAIAVIYRKQNYYSGMLSGQFWDTHFFSRSYSIMKSRYSLLVQGDKSFEFKVTNSGLKPEVIEVDDLKRYTWEKNNIPRPESESLRPGLVDIGNVLHISTFPDWNFVNLWYDDLSQNKAKTSFETEQIAKELFEENDKLTEKEKAQKIYDYIVTDIRYSHVSFRQSGLIPQDAGSVINTRVGDCKDVSALFVALAKEAGLEANIVLVNTRNRGKKRLALPSIYFNHAIAKVMIDDEPHFVELTTDNKPFGSIGRTLKNSFVLEVSGKDKNQEPTYLNPDTKPENYIKRETVIKFNEDNSMNVNKNAFRSGDYAASFRRSYRDDNDRDSEFESVVIADRRRANFNEVKFGDNLYNTNPVIDYEYSYVKENPFSRVSSLFTLELPWSDYKSSRDFLSDDERNYSLEYWRVTVADFHKESMTIHIPEGKELLEEPESVELSSSIADYSLTFEIEDDKIHAVRKTTFHDHTVSVDDFEEFRNFYNEVIEYDEMKLIFK